jgi:hypothetical protein
LSVIGVNFFAITFILFFNLYLNIRKLDLGGGGEIISFYIFQTILEIFLQKFLQH